MDKEILSINIHEALDTEIEIIIARNGRPAAKLVAVTRSQISKRLGVAKDILQISGDIDKDNDKIANLFAGASGQ